MGRKKIISGAVALILLGIGTAWSLGYFSQDPVVAEAIKAQQEIIETGQPPTEVQRDAMRERFQSMTDEQRRQTFQVMRPVMIKMMSERMNQFFDRSPEEIQKDISERADRIVAARAERKNNANSQGPNAGPGGPGGRGGWGDLSEEERDERLKKMLDFIPAESRAQFSQMRGMINKELDSRGEDPIQGREMRALFGGGMRGGNNANQNRSAG